MTTHRTGRGSGATLAGHALPPRRQRSVTRARVLALPLALALAGCAGAGTAAGPGAAQPTDVVERPTAPSAPSPAGSGEPATDQPATGQPGTDQPATDQPADLSGDLVVLAAASLSEVFTDLGAQLEAEHPELTITFNFAASSVLAGQVLAGAPADVYASASAATMAQVSAHAVDPAAFAANTLVIVTPGDNPGEVSGLDAFADPDLRLAVCAQEVPCGAAAAEVFAAQDWAPAISTYAQNVTAALNLAVTGEVDAALVYATDARRAGETVQAIEFPQAAQAVNDNLITVLSDARNPRAAEAFVALVLSPQGRQAFADAGFAPAQ